MNKTLQIIFMLFIHKCMWTNTFYTKNQPLEKQKNSIALKGNIELFRDGKKLGGVQVLFITLEKIYYSNVTEQDGSFEIKIPSEKTTEKNVILINYPRNCGLVNHDYYLLEDLKIPFNIKRKCKAVSGGYKVSLGYPKTDIILANGKEVAVNKITVDENAYPTQFIIDKKRYSTQLNINRKKIIKALYGKTKKKNLVLYFE